MHPSTPSPEVAEPGEAGDALTRRRFLQGAAATGTGLVAVTLAACAPTAVNEWTYATSRPQPPRPSQAPTPAASQAATPAATPAASQMPGMSPTPAPTPAPSAPAEPIPPGWSEHDVNARQVVRRYVGNLARPLGLDYMLGADWTDDPEYALLKSGNPTGTSWLEPKLDGDWKVFELTIDEIEHKVDLMSKPIKALGYNRMWPGPAIRVTEGDKVRAIFTNNLPETTGVHFHGVAFDDYRMDGVPLLTQMPIVPAGTFSYEFVARPYGSMMYHSHHNATDQVGRGLLGAFIIDPSDSKERYAEKYGVSQEIIWVHNDAFGGFTINGRQFPATAPIVARKGERILVRFMNEGIMMHPWHSHGFRMKVVARDGAPLGSAAFECDTLGVNPGERWDAMISCDRLGVWAFHCHILPHAEGSDGMFGMVTALVITP